MTRGKYAARAANREAARDNELLVEKLAEIDALTTQLADVKRLLAEERRERGAIIEHRIEERVAAAQLAVGLMIKDLRAEHAQRDRETAEWLARLVAYVNREATLKDPNDIWPYVFPTGGALPENEGMLDVEEMMARLVGQSVIGDLFEIAYADVKPEAATREWRRGRIHDYQRNDAWAQRHLKREKILGQIQDKEWLDQILEAAHEQETEA